MAGIVRLSRKFHETLGDDLAEELEAGFDQLDALNSAAFRELFDVRLEYRLGEATAKLRQEITEATAKVRQEITEAEARLRQEITKAEARLRQEITQLEARLRQEIAEVKAELRHEIAEVRVSLAGTESRLVRWMFLFWVGTIGISILLKL